MARMIDRSQYLRLTLSNKTSGRSWNLTDGTEGVEIQKNTSQLLTDADADTFYIKSIYGQSYQGFQWKQRRPTFGVNVHHPDPDQWMQIESDFRDDLGMFDDTFSITAEAPGSTRDLEMRLYQAPDSYSKGAWEGKSPFLQDTSTMAIMAACERPFWAAESIVYPCTFPTGNGTLPIWVENRGNVPIFLEWKLPAPGTWTVPDYSWGQELKFGRTPGQDATRTVTLNPLQAGEDLDLDTDPYQKQMVAASNTPVEQRNLGVQLMYPVAPKTPPTQVPLELVGGTANTTAYVVCPAWFSRPFGVSL
ncbi:hypothetical protein [Nocardia vaccinii]|uniref:hypothetical protein n=1 Tax=Nocardia vaccinii TaxID=1822 RepID=UPI0012F4F721|nr:hypothetical protein [Nocardia vaccinii]